MTVERGADDQARCTDDESGDGPGDRQDDGTWRHGCADAQSDDERGDELHEPRGEERSARETHV